MERFIKWKAYGGPCDSNLNSAYAPQDTLQDREQQLAIRAHPGQQHGYFEPVEATGKAIRYISH